MSAKCYSGRIFSKNLSAKYSSIKKQHQRRYFHIPPGAVYILFQLILIIFLFLFIPIFPYEFITDRNANTNQKHNCQNCEIHTITSHFLILHNPNGQEDWNRIHHDNSKNRKQNEKYRRRFNDWNNWVPDSWHFREKK